MNYYVYKITNLINGKIYVGQTTESLKKRFSRHTGYQLNYQDKLHRSIKKYGKENFKIELIEEVENQQILNEREQFWITELNSIETGYNIKNDGEKCGGDTLSSNPNLNKIKEKISKKMSRGGNSNARKIKAINLETGEIFEYDCLADCVDDLGFKDHSGISRRLRKLTKTPYKKIWMFEYL